MVCLDRKVFQGSMVSMVRWVLLDRKGLRVSMVSTGSMVRWDRRETLALKATRVLREHKVIWDRREKLEPKEAQDLLDLELLVTPLQRVLAPAGKALATTSKQPSIHA